MNKYTEAILGEILAALNAATPPADAALADVAIIELVTDYAQSKVRAESCRYHYESKEYDKEAAETLGRIRAALRARAVPELYCVGRANYPARGGNVGRNWHVVGVADVPYRTCVPKNGELLFVLAASKSGDGGAG